MMELCFILYLNFVAELSYEYQIGLVSMILWHVISLDLENVTIFLWVDPSPFQIRDIDTKN